MSTIPVLCFCLLVAALPLVAEEKASAAAQSPAAAVVATCAAAYNKGDAAAMAALFTEDAEWIDGDGHVSAGRPAIQAMFAEVFKASKGRTLELATDSVRPVATDVVAVKGTAVVSDVDGSRAVNSFTAVHVRRDGQWLISQYTETGSPFADAPASQLADLGALTGKWKLEGDGPAVSNTLEWSAGGNFLTRTFSVAASDGDDGREGSEIIAWDAELGKIRSWVFESDGSFSERVWTRDGNRYLIKSRTVLTDGGVGSEEITLTIIDKDRITWSTASRSVDGEALPNIGPVTSVREK